MEDDTESLSNVSIQESVDLDYFRDMYQYELKAKQETDSIEMSVEEENQIVCKIKEDILNQVRDEMESELEKYQLITVRTNSTLDSLQIDPYEQMDPVIRKGLYQIKKLDKILLRKMQREKEVKRERILLQKRLREELNELEKNNKQLSKEVKTNVMKFLALKPPIRHNEGMNEETAEDEIPKLFQTEINHEDTNSSTRSSDGPGKSFSGTSTAMTNPQSKKSTNTKKRNSNENLDNKSENKQSLRGDAVTKDKDFIKRNIELASKASESIPLTQAEKTRLEYLLADIDEENYEDSSSEGSMQRWTHKIEDNPFQVVTLDQYPEGSIITIGNKEGFQSALSDRSDITSIQHQLLVESKLKSYMGDENYKQLSKIDERSVYMESLSCQILQNNELEIDIDSLGENSLKEVKFSRECQKRLLEIDENLLKLKDSTSVDQLEERSLQILNTSSRNTISRSNMSDASDFCSEAESEEMKSESAPDFKVERLSQDILDSLLREARLCGITHKKLNSISETSETDDNILNTNLPDIECDVGLDPPRIKSERSTRFPDINLYKQMTSPIPKC